MKEYYVKEILEATKTQVKGFDNSRLIMAILDKFEAEVRVDQCDKDKEMAMNILNQNKTKMSKGEPKLDPYLDHLVTEDGRKYKKVHVMYVNGDKLVCDCCDEKKPRVVIRLLSGDITGLCEDCIRDMLTVFD
jgi:hypothetical protein